MKKIEIAINPKYDSADAVLSQIRKFLCISRTVLMLYLTFVLLIVLFYLAFMYLKDVLGIAYQVPAIFSSIYYVFMLLVICYFCDMGNQFLKSLESDGFKINKCAAKLRFIVISVLNALGMLNFSFVQIFNQINFDKKLIDCGNSVFFLVLSYAISYCYIFTPFVQSCYLVFILKYIAKVNEDGGLEHGQGDPDEMI